MPAIEDFGRKIGGAKKDIFAQYLEQLAGNVAMNVDDLKDLNVSKIFPALNYDALSKAGASNRAIAVLCVVRAGLPPKPKGARQLTG